jgi:hypothetical protein
MLGQVLREQLHFRRRRDCHFEVRHGNAQFRSLQRIRHPDASRPARWPGKRPPHRLAQGFRERRPRLGILEMTGDDERSGQLDPQRDLRAEGLSLHHMQGRKEAPADPLSGASIAIRNVATGHGPR